jgi:DnaJ-like protein
MSLAMILSSAALCISLVITAIKLIDGFVHADPRSLIRIGTWLLYLFGLASIPCLVVLLVYQQWALAMMLGAGMLIALTLLNWRSILARLPAQPVWPAGDDVEPLRGNYGQPAPNAELARRAAIVLEDYLTHIDNAQANTRLDRRGQPISQERAPRSPPMCPEEAFEVLGLERGASVSAIRAAHRRLVQLVHPDRGGSNYLAARINEAKDVLLGAAAVPKARVATRGKTGMTRRTAAHSE